MLKGKYTVTLAICYEYSHCGIMWSGKVCEQDVYVRLKIVLCTFLKRLWLAHNYMHELIM